MVLKAKRKPAARNKEEHHPPVSSQPLPIVGIGASAGGLDAFKELLEGLPRDTGMAFVFLQHLQPGHKSYLANLLSNVTAMPVTEVRQDTRIEPNHAYVNPPGANVTIAKDVLHLLPSTRRNGAGHPIDRFFNSLARQKRKAAIGVILSGTGSDGTLGLQAIKAAGGISFAQKERTARFRQMPHNAIISGAVDYKLAPLEIAKKLARVGGQLGLKPKPGGQGPNVNGRRTDGGDSSILEELLSRAHGVDFSRFRPAAIQRCVQQRMRAQKLRRIDDYVAYAHAHEEEVYNLYADLSSRLARFFRDAKTFTALKRKVFPELVKRRAANQPVRIWIYGCATGAPAYAGALLHNSGERTPH